MAAFLLPLAPLLGVDLKYRGVYTFASPGQMIISDVERHQCLEVGIENIYYCQWQWRLLVLGVPKLGFYLDQATIRE